MACGGGYDSLSTRKGMLGRFDFPLTGFIAYVSWQDSDRNICNVTVNFVIRVKNSLLQCVSRLSVVGLH